MRIESPWKDVATTGPEPLSTKVEGPSLPSVSYARFNEGDVYVFAATATGDWECCRCSLAPGSSFNCATRREMVEHLHQHRAVGHLVPDRAIADLLEEDAAGLAWGDHL
jgi:hypothetical protein